MIARWCCLLTLVVLAMSASIAFGEKTDMTYGEKPKMPRDELPGSTMAAGENPNQVVSTTLSIGLLVFGLIVIALEFWVLLRANRDWTELDFKTVITTIVIIMGAFLVVAGYSQNQITPIVGLLGAIIGYVLGKDAGPKPSGNQNDAQTENSGGE